MVGDFGGTSGSTGLVGDFGGTSGSTGLVGDFGGTSGSTGLVGDFGGTSGSTGLVGDFGGTSGSTGLVGDSEECVNTVCTECCTVTASPSFLGVLTPVTWPGHPSSITTPTSALLFGGGLFPDYMTLAT